MSTTPVDPGGGASSQSDIVMSDVPVHICEKAVIVDGLLCSIVKSMSNTNKDDELAAAIVSGMLEQEIKTSWTRLFTFYKEFQDESRKIPVLEIKRQTVRAMVDDILCCLRKKEISNDLHVFVLPWYYSMHTFLTYGQKLDQAMVKETVVGNEMRLNELETRLEAKFEKKYSDLITSLNSWSESFTRALQTNSYAAVTSNQVNPSFHNIPKAPSTLPLLNLPGMGNDQRLLRRPSVTSVQTADMRNRLGSLGNGQKRVRVEPQGTDSRSKDLAAKTVVGTTSSIAKGRKMRSPPADIFVWGMHPDTLPDDIVKDLAESGIVIEQKDVVKKSREGSALKSFKISVKAEDLQKALFPEVWPLRVKVIEYIYYPKKKSDQSSRDNAKSDQQSDNKSPSESSDKFTDQEVSNSTPTSVNEVVSQNSSASINLEKS